MSCAAIPAVAADVLSHGVGVPAFWCRIPSRPNLGDALTPWLIRRLSGRPPVFRGANDPRPKYLVTGSVIGFAGARTTVWGAGIMNRDDIISPMAMLRAVRGPLTRARAHECGAACPEIFGDPALLAPRFHPPPNRVRRGVVVVPHFSDMPRLAGIWRPQADIMLVDVQSRIETVLDAIASAELVASSSLHGIIVAHAYGIPAVWLKFRDLPSGDDSKFRDHFLAVGHSDADPVRIAYDAPLDVDLLLRRAVVAVLPDLEALWRACPFRHEAPSSASAIAGP